MPPLPYRNPETSSQEESFWEKPQNIGKGLGEEITCLIPPNPFGLRDKYRYFACLMRARFDEHKNEKDMVKATRLLREAEEEFWHNQHPQPYIFPDSPGGTSYERYECYKVGAAGSSRPRVTLVGAARAPSR